MCREEGGMWWKDEVCIRRMKDIDETRGDVHG